MRMLIATCVVLSCSAAVLAQPAEAPEEAPTTGPIVAAEQPEPATTPAMAVTKLLEYGKKGDVEKAATYLLHRGQGMEKIKQLVNELAGEGLEVTVVDTKIEGDWAFAILKGTKAGEQPKYESGPLQNRDGRWYLVLDRPANVDPDTQQKLENLAKWASERRRELRGAATRPGM